MPDPVEAGAQRAGGQRLTGKGVGARGARGDRLFFGVGTGGRLGQGDPG
ncbi:hypothetical protein LP420_16015 [Massilia sp. B-10]|nr:hypothetical protein LP420_16015 [Massilia sp. B-10]